MLHQSFNQDISPAEFQEFFYLNYLPKDADIFFALLTRSCITKVGFSSDMNLSCNRPPIGDFLVERASRLKQSVHAIHNLGAFIRIQYSSKRVIAAYVCSVNPQLPEPDFPEQNIHAKPLTISPGETAFLVFMLVVSSHAVRLHYLPMFASYSRLLEFVSEWTMSRWLFPTRYFWVCGYANVKVLLA